jgi:2-dehydro-3-deoxygluconokinase
MKFACVGECMIEISNLPDGGALRRFGGDTLNTAVYLARLGMPVDYITALGDDPYSDDMIAAWREEGLGVDQVQRVPGAVPGLYMIRTDAAGERSFHYWRDQAPARQMFEGAAGEAVARALGGYDWIYLSGITLSILDDAGRARLLAALKVARSGGAKVAFDGNYRPRGWTSDDKARAAFALVLPQIDLALPTYDDEQLLHDDADPAACAARYRDAGVAEVVIKLGTDGAVISGPEGVEQVPVPATITPVDTTAAGDSFNAGFLASRARGRSAVACAEAGHKLAGTVIQHRGAIIPINAMPDFEAT